MQEGAARRRRAFVYLRRRTRLRKASSIRDAEERRLGPEDSARGDIGTASALRSGHEVIDPMHERYIRQPSVVHARQRTRAWRSIVESRMWPLAASFPIFVLRCGGASVVTNEQDATAATDAEAETSDDDAGKFPEPPPPDYEKVDGSGTCAPDANNLTTFGACCDGVSCRAVHAPEGRSDRVWLLWRFRWMPERPSLLLLQRRVHGRALLRPLGPRPR
jgi:hypothetical protein